MVGHDTLTTGYLESRSLCYSFKRKYAATQGHTEVCTLGEGNSNWSCREQFMYAKQGEISWVLQASSGLFTLKNFTDSGLRGCLYLSGICYWSD